MQKNYLSQLFMFLCFVFVLSFNAEAYNAIDSPAVENDSKYPQRVKWDNWGLGIHVGNSYILGDIKSRPGLGLGLSIRKSLGHIVSVRGQLIYADMYGQSHFRIGGPGDENIILVNSSINGRNGMPDYTNSTFVHNYRTRSLDAGLQFVASSNNINFYNPKNKWNLYAFFGIGSSFYNTTINALDANDTEYDFSTIDFSKDEKDIKKDVRDLMDDSYETRGQESILKDKDWINKFTTTFGIGAQYRLNRRLALGIEHRYTRTASDYYDNILYRSILNNVSTTTDFDFLSYTNINLEIRLGKKTDEKDAAWWTNPIDPVVTNIDENEKKIKEITTDDDDDGVPNYIDEEKNTKPNMAVDRKGVTLDTDKDGVPDSLDEEVYSIPGAPVDKNGKAKDTDKDGIIDLYDKDNTTPPGTQVDNQGRSIRTTPEWYMPMIFFDLDKDNIKPDAYPALKQVAEVMTKYKDLKVEVRGNTDIRASEQYNQGLSERRANNAIDYLVNVYGISRDRFIVKAEGEAQPLYDKARRESQHKVNRRVEFKVAN